MPNWKQTLSSKLPKFKWWQILVIIFSIGIAAGLAWSGYSFNIGPFSCDKQQIKLKSDKR